MKPGTGPTKHESKEEFAARVAKEMRAEANRIKTEAERQAKEEAKRIKAEAAKTAKHYRKVASMFDGRRT
jgi:vacuolar-type H+-ATPase subunit E/Vma4